MKNFFGWVAAATFLLGSVAYADLDTVTLISTTGDSIGDVLGDVPGSGPWTVRDQPGVGDLWNDGDSFTFLHDSERKTGDFTATVRVAGQTAALDGRWGKGGLMIRHNLESDASNAMPAVYTGNGSQIDPPTADSNKVDHDAVDVRVNGRTINGANDGSFERPMFRDGAAFRNNLAPPAAPGDTNAPFNQAWLRVQYNSVTQTIVGAYADDVDGAPGDWAYSDPINDVDVPADGWYVGPAYSTHNDMVADDLITDDNPEGLHGMIFDNYSFSPVFLLPLSKVAGDDIGGIAIGGDLSNLTLGPEETASGLTNYFYDRNMRGVIEGEDGFLEATGRGDSENRDPGEFGPVYNPLGWWSGNSGPLTIGGNEIPKYPVGTFADDDRSNYGAVATGQVWITGNGDHTFVDGIDDFALVAVDLNGDGTLESLGDLADADVPASGDAGGFDDIAILDDDWVGTNGGGGNGGGNNIAVVTFSEVSGDGEWRDFEVWMSEEGGGDAGLVFFGKTDEFDPDLPLTAEQQDEFILKPDQLQTVTNPIISGESNAALRTDVNLVMQVGAAGSDQISVDDQDGVLTTSLDVAGATVTIEDAGDLGDSGEFLLFDADSITGVDDLILNLPDGDWDKSILAQGILKLGVPMMECDPTTGGDLDGNGKVEFGDFLILSAHFNEPPPPLPADSHTVGDINCDGKVDFADFLVLSGNFGKDVGGAESVPEPSSLFLLGFAGLMGGLLRRRRS